MRSLLDTFVRPAPVVLVMLTANACAPSAAIVDVKDPTDTALAGELVGPDGQPAPFWVTQPSKYLTGASGEPVLCAEGSVVGARNIGLAQSGSQARARTALARTLEVKVQSMIKDYQSSTTTGGSQGSAGSDEQAVVDVSKQITDTSLAGTSLLETWVSSRGTMHSLVCLDLEKFRGTVSSMKQVDDGLRRGIDERAAKSWSEVDNSTHHR